MTKPSDKKAHFTRMISTIDKTEDGPCAIDPREIVGWSNQVIEVNKRQWLVKESAEEIKKEYDRAMMEAEKKEGKNDR